MSPSSERRGKPLETMVRFNQLMDAYGGLLTDRQRRLAQLHFGEDLSFSEIAEEEGVSRQAAHDAVKHATMALEKFEGQLHLVDGGGKHSSAAPKVEKAVEALEALNERLQRSSGVIYSSDWIVEAVEETIALLQPESD